MPSTRVDRREVLQLAAAGMTSSLFASAAAEDSATKDSATKDGASDHDAPGFAIVDTNVSLFSWPFRRLPLDTSDALIGKLRSLGVTRALTGSFEGLLHRDIASVNDRLADACSTCQELIPVGSVNPVLPNWREDLQRCAEQHGMPGVRLHPGYHGYPLHAGLFSELVERATAAGLFVQLAASMEDQRTQHSLVRVPDVDLTPLPGVLAAFPQATVQVLNARPRAADVASLRDTPGLLFDTARIDGTDAVPALLRSLPPERVLFGSHAPLLVPEAAMIRVHESGQLNHEELYAVYAGNAVTRLGVTLA